MDNIPATPDTIFKIVLSSAVIAALITGIINYLAVRRTNKRLFEIENLKIRSELTTFRYTKLFGAIEEFNNLPAIDTTYVKRKGDSFVHDKTLLAKVISETTKRFGIIANIFERVKPLIDDVYVVEANLALAEESRQSNLMTEAVYKNLPLPEGIDVVTLMSARESAAAEIKSVMNRQLSILTKAMNS